MVDNGTNPCLARALFQLRASGVKSEANNKLLTGLHSRGYLPHIKREGASYFVTFRLADSLPREVLLRFERELAETRKTSGTKAGMPQSEPQIEFRRKIERYLDAGCGACHLRTPAIARVAAETLLHFDGHQYLLKDWVIMPNHVHIVLFPMPGFTLSAILRSRKRRIARQANIILRRTGQTFWQPESYDHWIRNDDEAARIQRYVRNNPVSAGLCAKPEDWQWSSAGWSRIP